MSEMLAKAGLDRQSIIAGMADATAEQQANFTAILLQLMQGSAQDIANINLSVGASADADYTSVGAGLLMSIIGAIGTVMAAPAAVAPAAAASDSRLKENVRQIGRHSNGLSIYSWSWTEEAKAMVGNQRPIGFMADEVRAVRPDAVSVINGYDHVDYGSL